VARTCKLSNDELQEFFNLQNVFKEGQTSGLSFGKFKQLFFPHMTVSGEDTSNDFKPERGLDYDKTKWKGEMMHDLKDLENKIRDRLKNNYSSVRKAFLDLDYNHDGFVEPTDIIRMFGFNVEIHFDDLLKIMSEKASTKDANGGVRLNYSDFSKWLGAAIHQAEGFYFRHDSKKNADYQIHVDEHERRKGSDNRQAADSLVSQDMVLPKIIAKIKQQWKTIRKAFKDFNENNDGSIDKDELLFYLKHWGFPIGEG
jgi:hypothetical protein